MCMRKCTDNPDCNIDPDMFLYTTTTDYVTSTFTSTTTTPNISMKCEAGSHKLKCADGYYCDNAIVVEGVYDTIIQAGTCKMCPESSEEFCKSQYFLRLVFKLIVFP